MRLFLNIGIRLLILFYIPYLFGVLLVLPGIVYLVWLISGEFPIILSAIFGVILFFTLVQILVATAGLWGELPERTEMEFEIEPDLLQPLYQKADEVADELGLPRIDEIRLSAVTAAAAYENNKGKRILLIGGMSLACLTEEALSGVIAHELARFVVGETRLSRLATRVAFAMMILEEQFALLVISWFNPLSWLIFLYHRLFLLFWAMHSRQQEFAADRFLVEQAGKEAAAKALMRIVMLEEMSWTRIDSIAGAAARSAVPVEDLFTEQWYRASHTSKVEWSEACYKAMRKKTKLLDSHPSLKDRLKAIRIKPKKAVELAMQKGGQPAFRLFPRWADLEAMMSEELLYVYRSMHKSKKEVAQIVLGRPV